MAKLSYKRRKRMPKRDFALPSKRKGGRGGLPIPDERHGRAALARASMMEHRGEISKSQEESVDRKVHRRFPDIGRRSSHRGKRRAPRRGYRGRR